ncbi:MAG: sigma 54-interacting transcriptional regulator [Oscillospiraceae bacterium]|nr:sigma 54-interacting transcriptional regulator [Oscillospiraceae bacterium]
MPSLTPAQFAEPEQENVLIINQSHFDPPLITSFEMSDFCGDAFYIVRPDGMITNANKTCEHIFGIPPEEMIGKNIEEMWTTGVFAPAISYKFGYTHNTVNELIDELDDHEIVQPADGRWPRLSLIAASTKCIVSGITQLQNNDLYVLYVCVPVYQRNGEVAFVDAVVRDLTWTMRLRSQIHRLEHQLKYEHMQNSGESSLIGNCKQMGNVKYLIGQVARSDVTVLITGETGTGKEVVSREIVAKSNRADKPYICINCSAIPETLFESELFGYEKGAFTGALNKRKIGLLETANGGTVLLDEVESLPMIMQTKLLRVIQEREIMRIGGSGAVKIDIRFIAASNRDLQTMVQEGTFREDLYYRLNVVPINLPPLRERDGDIPALAAAFLAKFNQKYDRDKFFEAGALLRLESHDWPGNVRDLEHTVERLVVIGEFSEITSADADAAITGNRVASAPLSGTDLRSMMDSYEKVIISNAIRKYHSTRKAAAALGISQPTFLRRMKYFGVASSEE